jgi:hypothetical protein
MRARGKADERSAQKSSTTPKIIVQYRAKATKVYELQSNGSVVAVRIFQDDDEMLTAGWHVDAQSDCTRGLALIEAWGKTAAEALTEVARTWNAHHPPLTTFDRLSPQRSA